MATKVSSLPPDLFDQTTLVSLTATVTILAVAYIASQRLLSAATPNSLRILFIWHFFDFLVHFCIEGSLLYHCFFTSIPASSVKDVSGYYPTPYNYLGTTDQIWGPQAGNSFTAKMWMIYARADKRWAGADLVCCRAIDRFTVESMLIDNLLQTVICLEILTVGVVGPLAVLVCYDIAKRNPRADIIMIVIATCELYGGKFFLLGCWILVEDTSIY
jgi:hypothetical protein